MRASQSHFETVGPSTISGVGETGVRGSPVSASRGKMKEAAVRAIWESTPCSWAKWGLPAEAKSWERSQVTSPGFSTP